VADTSFWDPALLKPYTNPVTHTTLSPDLPASIRAGKPYLSIESEDHPVSRNAAVLPSSSFKNPKKTVSELPDELEVDEEPEVDDEDVFDVPNRKKDAASSGDTRAIGRVAAWTKASALPRTGSRSRQTSLREDSEEPEVVDSDSDKENEEENYEPPTSGESADEGVDEDYMPVSKKE
jgi:hypothetical protein